MPINILSTDILKNTEGLIVLPIDGIGPGHEGRLARHYAETFSEHWSLISKKLEFPLALGKTSFSPKNKDIEGFDFVLVAAILNHLDELSRDNARGIVLNVTRQALNLAAGFELARVATVVLKGGWRLSLDEAFMAMLDACESFSGMRKINFEIFEQDQGKFNRILGLGKSLGWL